MLTERQYEVLMAIVFEYIHTGEPVGSRSLSKKYLTRVSAATIRNEMADLEEMGYITQPHTSAGRVPTGRAFRVYVDSILDGQRQKAPELADRLSELIRRRADFEEVLAYSSQLLSRATQTVALAASAPVAQVRLERVEFVPVDLHHALLLVVLQGRLIHQKLLSFPCEMNRETLDEIARRINMVASGRSWSEVRGGLQSFLLKELAEVAESCRISFGHRRPPFRGPLPVFHYRGPSYPGASGLPGPRAAPGDPRPAGRRGCAVEAGSQVFRQGRAQRDHRQRGSGFGPRFLLRPLFLFQRQGNTYRTGAYRPRADGLREGDRST